MLKKVAIFKALDVEIKKQRGHVAVKEAYKGHHSLKEELSQQGITIIAEVAGGDPARGRVREGYKASTHAKSLVENGARVVSVATDKFLYGGEDKSLSEARSQVKVPVLRREFIFEEYQVEESKILGADAIYLMPALLSAEKMELLHKLALAKGLDVVFEVTTEAELARALEAGAEIICAVGRNLDTWVPSWEQAIALIKKVPKRCLVMAEVSIHSLAQIKELDKLGVHGVIVGDALLDDFYPGKRLAQLLAGIDPPKKSPKAKATAEKPAVSPTPAPAPAASGSTSTPRKDAIAKPQSGAKSKEPSRTTPSTTARKGAKEPTMADDMMNMAAPAAAKPAKKKAAPKKKAAAKKKAAPKKAAAKKAAPKKKAAKKAAKKATKKAAPKKKAAKKATKKAAPKKKAAKKATKKAAPKKKAAKKAAKKK